jgi:TolB-like protein/DNA-binding winged helix-turn-helix (wHTH) protein
MRLSPHVVRFGSFQLDLSAAELTRGDSKIKLGEQPFQVLAALLDHPGDIVTREELRQRLWHADTFVDFDHSLNAAVNRLRLVLEDSPDQPCFIETLPRHGYRFIAKVEKPGPESQTSVVSRVMPVVAGLLALAMLFGGYFLWKKFHPSSTPGSPVVLAVLPLINLGGDHQPDYLSDGLTEEITSQLGRQQPAKLRVIARTSAMNYRGTTKSIGQIGRELRADYLLEGSVRHEAGRVRINVQLVQVRDQTYVWAAIYDRSLSGVLALQSEIAETVARQIEGTLAPPQKSPSVPREER